MRQGFDAEFQDLLNDVLSLHKPDGRVFEHIRAYVSVKGILIMDATLPIQAGDVLTRTLTSGLKEDFIVDDPRFQQGILGMPAHFQVKVHPAGADRLPRSSQTEFGIGLYALSDPPALFPGRAFPRFVYHATQEPKMVSTAEEETALGPEWSRTYIHQDYPKVKYHWTREPITVTNAEEEADLGGGWANTPAAFDPYKGARPTRTEQQDPTKWLEEWTALRLSSSQRTGIKAQLLRADATFDRSLPDPDSAAVAAMRQAFDGIARVLFDAGILTEQLLKNEIPLFVWDSAIAGGWYRFASAAPTNIFPERLGHYWVWQDDSRDWKGLFRAENREWHARLLETPGGGQRAADPFTFFKETRPLGDNPYPADSSLWHGFEQATHEAKKELDSLWSDYTRSYASMGSPSEVLTLILDARLKRLDIVAEWMLRVFVAEEEMARIYEDWLADLMRAEEKNVLDLVCEEAPHYREYFNHEKFTQTLLLRQQSYKEKCDSKVIQLIRERRAARAAESATASTQLEPNTSQGVADVNPHNLSDALGSRTPRRTPDIQSSQERIRLADTLARELALVKHETKTYCTIEGLKRKYPTFTLWTLIENSQIKELVEGEAFVPKAYAENLVLIKYGLTSRETLKKDRRKLRNAKINRKL